MAPTLSEQTRAFLEAPRFGVLGTTQSDGTPQLTVMWYELDGDEILMNTTVQRAKAANLRRDPRIALCVEDGYSYVTLYGTARLVEDQATAQADIHRLAARYHNPAKADQMMRDQFGKQQRLTIRMRIERIVEHW
ncbi:MAG TPA: PPOX class F420-dependent oxidoreductase [Chloroflexaceae bacterium]|nr:PPOX class F420-dependent oxidoreductase [Chloroflexaceae bacterium]